MNVYFEGYLFDLSTSRINSIKRSKRLVDCYTVVGLDFFVSYANRGEFFVAKFYDCPIFYIQNVRENRRRCIIENDEVTSSKFSYIDILREIGINDYSEVDFCIEEDFFEFRDARISEEIESFAKGEGYYHHVKPLCRCIPSSVRKWYFW